jgi:RNA polymerase sigma-70 factor (ECF subfamily)
MELALKDEALFSQMRLNDSKAFEMLFKRHYKPLCRRVNTMLNDEEATEDVVQQLFIKIWESRETLQTPDSVAAYLFTAARNRALNYIKSQSRKSSNEVPLTNLHDEADNRMEEQMDAKELQKALYAAIDALPEKRREVFVLSRFEGKSYKEIAEIMQISVKTVEAQMGKALSTLREFVRNNHHQPLILAIFMIWLGGE